MSILRIAREQRVLFESIRIRAKRLKERIKEADQLYPIGEEQETAEREQQAQRESDNNWVAYRYEERNLNN